MKLGNEIEKKIHKIEGDVIIHYPSVMNLYIVILLLIFSVFFIFIFIGHYNRVIHVNGYTSYTHNEVKVYSPESGIITKKYFSTGDNVDVGTPLFEIISQKCSSKKISIINELRNKTMRFKDKISQVKKIHTNNIEDLNLQIKNTKDDISNLKNIYRIKANKVELQSEKNKIMKESLKRKIIDRSSVFSGEILYNEYLEQKYLLENNINSKKNDLKELNKKIDKENLSLEVETNNIMIKISDIKNAIYEIQSHCMIIVKSSIKGQITLDQSSIGNLVSNEKPISVITPYNSMINVTLLVPSESIGSISLNQKVKIKYDSYPYQYYGTFNGYIYKINTSSINSSEIYNNHIPDNKSYYIVKVKIEDKTVTVNGKERNIISGIKVKSDIEIEEQNITDWLLSPLSKIRN